jgi:hypothetical protein
VCESAERAVRRADGSRRVIVPGYARGLCATDRHVFVGSSVGRRISRSMGIANPADPGESTGGCGVSVLDQETLAVLDFIDLGHLSTEIYEIELLD